MDYSNYTLFEITKYKIEFLDCLEYSLISNNIKEEDIKNRINYLNNDFKEGFYKEIVSTLFTSYNLLNKPIIHFLKKYNHKNILKLIKNKKVKHLITYNENLIDCHETFSYIISAFTEEEQIATKLDKKILNLIEINKKHFINFLFFNTYNLYLNCFYNKENNLKHSNKDIENLIKIINYCNKEKEFDNSINILKEENEDKIYNELENLSNICIRLEKEQYNCLNELVNIINNETKKNKK